MDSCAVLHRAPSCDAMTPNINLQETKSNDALLPPAHRDKKIQLFCNIKRVWNAFTLCHVNSREAYNQTLPELHLIHVVLNEVIRKLVDDRLIGRLGP